MHFSGVLCHVRYIEKLERIKFYESLYKDKKKTNDLRRASQQNKRMSLLGGIEASQFAHVFAIKVYERCRSINMAVKLLIGVALSVLCILSIYDYLPHRAFYELAIVISIELGVYVSYIDYLPKFGPYQTEGKGFESPRESLSNGRPEKPQSETAEVSHDDSCSHLVASSSGADPLQCVLNNQLYALEESELERLEFSGSSGLQVPALFYLQRLSRVSSIIN